MHEAAVDIILYNKQQRANKTSHKLQIQSNKQRDRQTDKYVEHTSLHDKNKKLKTCHSIEREIKRVKETCRLHHNNYISNPNMEYHIF